MKMIWYLQDLLQVHHYLFPLAVTPAVTPATAVWVSDVSEKIFWHLFSQDVTLVYAVSVNKTHWQQIIEQPPCIAALQALRTHTADRKLIPGLQQKAVAVIIGCETSPGIRWGKQEAGRGSGGRKAAPGQHLWAVCTVKAQQLQPGEGRKYIYI